ncbi:MAG: alkaline phosphatase family protein [Nitrososphaeria archaeon]
MSYPKAFVIVLDAFSSRYLSPRLSPCLYNLSQQWFYTTIKPVFAYGGIGFTLRTGLPISLTGVWGDHVLKKRNMKLVKSILFKNSLKIIDAFSIDDYENKALRYALFKFFREKYGTPHLIPADLIEYFSVIDTPANKNVECNDIFATLKKLNKNNAWVEPKLNFLEEKALKNAASKLQFSDLVILKLNSLDRLGHRFGPLSKEVEARLKYLDHLLCVYVKKVLNKYPNLLLIIMSDHGMCPVLNTINIEQKLKQLPLQMTKEYFAYIGTTLIHFWFLKEEAKRHVENMLQKISKYGKILEDKDFLSMGLGRIDRRLYGETIFALYEHNIFHPDFYYKRRPPRGMHGYPYYTWDSAVFIANNYDGKFKVNFENIQQIILRHIAQDY